MSKKTAFGGDNNYQEFKSEGLRIGNENDSIKLREWLNKLRSEEPTLVQQASAVCHAVSDISPHLFRPFQKELIDVLKKNIHPAGPRFTYRLLAQIQIDEDYQGEAIDLSFKALMNPSSPIAIMMFAMTVIANQIKQYPDLSGELEAALQFKFEKGSAGFKSRARKIAETYGLRLDENM